MGKRIVSALTLLVYGVSANGVLFFISTPVVAQSSSQVTTRLTVPLASNANLVVENSSGTESHTALISDSLASTKIILSSDGTTVSALQYYPYGTSLASQSNKTNGTDTTNVSDRYYTGQRKVADVDSPLYNYNARYYNPDIGLFTQPDSIQGPNRFAYVGGNPIAKNDPTGHNWCEADPWLSPLWGALGQCAQEEAQESDPSDWTQEAGMSSVAELTETVDGFTNGLGTAAVAIGDKVSGTQTKVSTAGSNNVFVVVALALATGWFFSRSAGVATRVPVNIQVAQPKQVGSIAPELYENAGNITLHALQKARANGISVRMFNAEDVASVERYYPGHSKFLSLKEIAALANPNNRNVAINQWAPAINPRGSILLHEVTGHLLGKQRLSTSLKNPALWDKYPTELLGGLDEIEAYGYQARNIRGALQAFGSRMNPAYRARYESEAALATSAVIRYQRRVLDLIARNGYSHETLRTDLGPMYDYLYRAP